VPPGIGLPPAELLERYNQLIPDGGERLLAMVEQQADHRQQMERSADQRAWWGLAAAFVVSMSFLGSSVWLIASGARLEGTILGTVDLVALASVFVYGSLARRTGRSE
jgi:uncharacterized membrane protein